MIEASERAALRQDFARDHARAAPETLVRASEDAGLRSYWRIQGRNLVIMDAPPADNDLAPWLAMRDLLEQGGVRVPRLRARDLEHGFLLLEDLGEKTLLQCLDGDSADRLFDDALEQLVRLQAIAPPATMPAYDAVLLGAELDLFSDWFIGRELGLVLSEAERAAWLEARGQLIERALQQPSVLVHRDFMPRNLMPLPGDMAVIDFQDAVTGPVAYDPVCLFKDAFVSWPDERVRGWLEQYHRRALEAGIAVPGRERFMVDAELIGMQRHLKVIGIFARLKHRDAKPRYLEDTPRFIAYLDAVLPRHPKLAPLQALLRERVWPAWHQAAGA